MSTWTTDRFIYANNINTRTLANLDNTIAICKSTGMYLGIYNHINEDFHYEWVKSVIDTEMGFAWAMNKYKSKSTRKKKQIPKKIKIEIWSKYIGDHYGQSTCMCCRNTIITQNKFVGGHVKSESNGGLVNMDNLRPICSGCNSSMGSTNMDDYMLEYYPDNILGAYFTQN